MTTTDQYTSTSPLSGMSEYSSMQVPQFEEDLDAIRDAEKKLNREGNTLAAMGTAALAAGGTIFGMTLAGVEFAEWWPMVILAGVAASAFGVVKVLTKIARKSLKFPLLKKIKKAVRQERHTAQANQKQTRARTRQGSRSQVFEETYVRNTLARSRKDKVFMGVCGGIAAYSGTPPSVMRLIFLLGLFFSAGVILPVYFILALTMPWRDDK